MATLNSYNFGVDKVQDFVPKMVEDIVAVNSEMAEKLPKSGGTMTGAIVLAGPATSANHPVTKSQMESAIAGHVGQQIIWNAPMIASAEENEEPSAVLWSQSTETYGVKFSGYFMMRAGIGSLRLIAGAMVASSGHYWDVALRCGAVVGSATGTNDSFGGSPEVNISIDISGLTPDTFYYLTVEVKSNHIATVRPRLIASEPA